MARLEELTPGTEVRGVVPDQLVTVVAASWHGKNALTLTFRTAAGQPNDRLLYRDDEPRLEVVVEGRPWSFDGDGSRKVGCGRKS